MAATKKIENLKQLCEMQIERFKTTRSEFGKKVEGVSFWDAGRLAHRWACDLAADGALAEIANDILRAIATAQELDTSAGAAKWLERVMPTLDYQAKTIFPACRSDENYEVAAKEAKFNFYFRDGLFSREGIAKLIAD